MATKSPNSRTYRTDSTFATNARVCTGFTQAKMAEHSDISERKIRAIETGEGASIPVLKRFADACNVAWHDLLVPDERVRLGIQPRPAVPPVDSPLPAQRHVQPAGPPPVAPDPPHFPQHVPVLTAFGIEVPNCILEFDFTRPPLDASAFRVMREPHPRPQGIPGALLPHRQGYLVSKEQEAAKKRPLTNDPSFALVRMLDCRSWEEELRTRTHQYELHVRDCYYFDFLWPNNCLRDEITIDGQTKKLRDHLGIGEPRLTGLESMPVVTPKLGAGVVVLTSDGYVVVTKRSDSLIIAAGGYHLSVAEGMLREDLDDAKPPAPFANAERGLWKELSLVAGQDYQRSELRCLGVVLDTERVQPMFFFVLNTHLTFRQVTRRWARAEDQSENPNLIQVRWSPPNACRLIRGEIEIVNPADGATERRGVASNHAQAGFALAALYSFDAAAGESS